ncbi:MAG: hypothetical protein HY519_03505, partial [Candidatus Aenigmarchaeota archaeon]|nr:hypothetical protein [Candidatus Aenigmarchaeota archaeon]
MITLTTFDGRLETHAIEASEIPEAISKPHLTWVNCVALGKEEVAQILRDVQEIPDFLIDDCTTKQRPKIDDYESVVSVIFKQLSRNTALKTNQLNIIFGPNYVLTIFFEKTELVAAIAKQLEKNLPRVKKMGVSYVIYHILDAIVDSYHPLADELD